MSSLSLRTCSIVAVLAAAVGYLVVSLHVDSRADAAGQGPHPALPPFVVFRALAPRDAYGRVAIMPLRPDATPQLSALSCSRVHYAGGRGLCASQESVAGKIVNVAYVFDRTLTQGRRIVLDGIPTRLRVAPNARVGAITTYAEEETPAGERLATRTRIFDLGRGTLAADLGDFHIDNFVLPLVRPPIDITGLSFEGDGDRFFASVSSGGERYLVAGSMRERRMSTLQTGVASESISPDGNKLAVKRLVPERGFWQLAVIDLHTWTEQALLQGPRSVDDQVEWLDNNHVLYHDVDGDSTALWMLPVDGISGPRIFVRDAYSGSIQR